MRLKGFLLSFVASTFLILDVHGSGAVESILHSATRDLWTCDSLDCHSCIALPDRMYCSSNNKQGSCCTKTDGRDPCSNTKRNCSSAPGFNLTNNFAYLVCGFNDTQCGINPAPVISTDPEYDPRFGSNFIIARGDAVTVTTPAGMFLRNKRCTWVISKTFNKQGLSFWVTSNSGVTITAFRGG
jgi:hypothetical protein